MLPGLHLPPFLDTSTADLISDFFVPTLAQSVRYDRGVGYFSSGWLRIAARGMVQFAANGGRARWVTSPILTAADWEALQTGDTARTDLELRLILDLHVADLATSLEKDTLSALAWMVADEILDFRIALPRNKLERGDFHDKFGVFTDVQGNQISFNGSYNDSIQGTRNYESIKLFPSWDPAFAPLVRADVHRFERLWTNMDANVRVFDLPEAARQQLLQLKSESRPYPAPEWIKPQRIGVSSYHRIPQPAIPDSLALRDYQVKAIDAWFDNGCVGLLEMATGTGKTITSLSASIRLFARERHLALVIACPYQHLVDQWYDEATNFGYFPLKAYQSRSAWLDRLNERAMAYNHGDVRHLCVITTHSTFATNDFQKAIARIKGPSLLIADEVHHLGAEHSRIHLPESVPYRLALSATPDRWYDDLGTQAIRDYFDKTVFVLSLAEAIGLSLTPYYYYPILVELTAAEVTEYRALSTRVAQLLSKGQDLETDERVSRLLIKRANLLNAAENKIGAVSDLVDRQESIDHALFYCAPGQIDAVVQLLGWEKRIQVHRFTAQENIATRQDLLQRFDKGELQALAAMHCLDEGVDVPSTKTAFILASSGNPRQFIQRRGRVLRKHPGKLQAVVYDLITVPPLPDELDPESVDVERSIMRRELKRFCEFADSALNTQTAYDVIWNLADRFGVLDFE